MMETVLFIGFVITVMGCFLSTCPHDGIKPWMRAAFFAISLTAILWVPWAWRFAVWNYECTSPVSVEVTK